MTAKCMSVQLVTSSSVRPPTKASCMCQSSEYSVQCLLQFLHGKCPHRLGGWLGLENARLLGEWVDALLGWSGWLLLQLQVQHACELEVAVLLDLTGGNAEESVDDSLHLLVLQ